MLDRLRNLSRLSALGLLATAVVGCDSSTPSSAVKPTASPTTGEAATASSSLSDSPAEPERAVATGAAAPHSPTQVDPQAVDEQGYIVLESGPATPPPVTSDSAAQSAASAGETAPANQTATVAQTAPAATEPPAQAPARLPEQPTALPAAANVASAAERQQALAADWPKPQAVLFVSGQQHGYLEPCGCTGLENQKGGLIRRDTLLTSLRERGWDVVPVDVGNQVRRIGRQPELKFQTTVTSFRKMDYAAATLGVDDLKLSSVELIQAASSDELNQGIFISANVSVLDPSFFPESRTVEVGGRKIGITAVLSPEYRREIQSDDIEIANPIDKLTPVVAKLKKENCDFIVLLAHASLEESAAMAQAVPGIDLVVTAGGFGEPTLEPQAIEGTQAVMVQVGTKGMYGGIVGLFDDAQQPLRYQKIAISSQFKDSQRMLKDFEAYQLRLQEAGFAGLGVLPISHPTGNKFVGSETCGECHTTAYEIWEGTPHHHATESIVNPPNDRGGIHRHFDPECVSCHVTGWNPQQYYPYESGYANLADSEHLLGSGCENCHGPGSKHVAAEYGDMEADNEMLEQLRQQMVLPLARARDKCLECHDLDNSPDFHTDGAFDEFWERVKHYGKD